MGPNTSKIHHMLQIRIRWRVLEILSKTSCLKLRRAPWIPGKREINLLRIKLTTKFLSTIIFCKSRLASKTSITKSGSQAKASRKFPNRTRSKSSRFKAWCRYWALNNFRKGCLLLNLWVKITMKTWILKKFSTKDRNHRERKAWQAITVTVFTKRINKLSTSTACLTKIRWWMSILSLNINNRHLLFLTLKMSWPSVSINFPKKEGKMTQNIWET